MKTREVTEAGCVTTALSDPATPLQLCRSGFVPLLRDRHLPALRRHAQDRRQHRPALGHRDDPRAPRAHVAAAPSDGVAARGAGAAVASPPAVISKKQPMVLAAEAASRGRCVPGFGSAALTGRRRGEARGSRGSQRPRGALMGSPSGCSARARAAPAEGSGSAHGHMAHHANSLGTGR